ncbi:MAG: hypothetical protein HY726_22920 [Candidatus Rokubacteria bacterium]|nr:hypothetical protein [Candidatus Rokubacteria bacterium]
MTVRPEALKRHDVVVLRPRRTMFPRERRGPGGDVRRFDLSRIYVLSAARETLIPGIRIPFGRSLAVAIQVLLPPDVTEGVLTFDVVQRLGKRIVGESACIVQPR